MLTEPAPASKPSPPPAAGGKAAGAGRGRAIRTPPPILASEALREDVAPLEPGKRALRFWMVGLGLVILAVGSGLHLGLLPGGFASARISYALGAALLGSAVLPFPYSVRGILAATVGVATLGLGVAGYGPASALVLSRGDLPWEIARAVAASGLAAALLFRSRYRAYRGARIVLAASLVAALPALVRAGVVAVSAGQATARIGAAAVLLSVLTSLLGFMGSGTTAASTAWAVAVLSAFSGDVMLRAVWAKGFGTTWVAHVQAGSLFLVAATLVALGVFQVLSWAMASDARRVDVLGQERPAPAEQPPEEE